MKISLVIALLFFVVTAIGADSRTQFHANNVGSWSPLYLGANLAAWYDASDSSTVFTNVAGTTKAVSGNTVAFWKDKSLNGYNATQATAGSRPTLTAQGLVFAGNASATCFITAMTVANLTNSSFNASIFAVITPSAGNQAYAGIVNWRNGGGNNTGLIVDQTASQFAMDWVTNGLYGWSPGDPFTNGTRVVTGFVNSSNGAVGAQTFSYNGTTYTNNVATISTAGDAWIMYLGTDSGFATRYFYGTMYEVVIVNTNLSVANRQKLEGYLAWKWGTQASLVAGHPYLHFAP